MMRGHGKEKYLISSEEFCSSWINQSSTPGITYSPHSLSSFHLSGHGSTNNNLVQREHSSQCENIFARIPIPKKMYPACRMSPRISAPSK